MEKLPLEYTAMHAVRYMKHALQHLAPEPPSMEMGLEDTEALK